MFLRLEIEKGVLVVMVIIPTSLYKSSADLYFPCFKYAEAYKDKRKNHCFTITINSDNQIIISESTGKK